MIYVGCPSCGHQFGPVEDGAKVVCPNCGNSGRAKNVENAPSTDEQQSTLTYLDKASDTIQGSETEKIRKPRRPDQ